MMAPKSSFQDWSIFFPSLIPLRRHKIALNDAWQKGLALYAMPVFSPTLSLPIVIQHAVQYTMTSCCDLSHDDYSSEFVFFTCLLPFLFHFTSIFQGPASISYTLAPLFFHSPSASFFPHPTLGDISVFHISFLFTLYAMCVGPNCQDNVPACPELLPVTWSLRDISFWASPHTAWSLT